MDLDVDKLGGHSHECRHCRPFWRSLRDGTFVVESPSVERGVECPQCGRPLEVVFAAGAHRCAECGIADLQSEGHTTQLWWSEDPNAGALTTGWGGSEIWACSCGERAENDSPMGQRWAMDHADLNGGRFVPPSPQTN